MALVQIAHNAVTAAIKNPTREVLLAVQQTLSFSVNGAEHTQTFKSGHWNGRSSLLDFKKGTFPRGFALLVKSALEKQGHTVQLLRNPLPEPLGPEFPIVDTFAEDPRYDYQPDVVRRLLRNGQMIAQVATGGGKSRICKLAIERINRPTLFLTTRGVLMYQMAEALATLPSKKKVAILGDGQISTSKDVTCGMVQTIISWLEETTPEQEAEREVTLIQGREDKAVAELKSKLVKAKAKPQEIIEAIKKLKAQQNKDRPTDKEIAARATEKAARQAKRRALMVELLAKFELVVLEEAHEASGNSYYEILKHCKNAHYRLALTATPFMKEDEEANMRLMAVSGHVGIKVTEEMLIQRGILARPFFKFVNLKQHPPLLYKSTPWPRSYELGIVENEYRNRHIIAEAKRAKMYGLPVMVLLQHKKHGRKLHELMQAAGLNVEYIFGEDDQAARKAALLKLKSGAIDVLIGSTILDVGVDVPAVGMVILAGGGKAEVALRQRIGRGLREKKNGLPNVAFIVDFTDSLNNTLRAHALQRRNIVETTRGFAENVVEDFDFAGLGFKKVA